MTNIPKRYCVSVCLAKSLTSIHFRHLKASYQNNNQHHVYLTVTWCLAHKDNIYDTASTKQELQHTDKYCLSAGFAIVPNCFISSVWCEASTTCLMWYLWHTLSFQMHLPSAIYQQTQPSTHTQQGSKIMHAPGSCSMAGRIARIYQYMSKLHENYSKWLELQIGNVLTVCRILSQCVISWWVCDCVCVCVLPELQTVNQLCTPSVTIPTFFSSFQHVALLVFRVVFLFYWNYDKDFFFKLCIGLKKCAFLF